MLANQRFDALFLTLETGRYMSAQAGFSEEISFIPFKSIPLRPFHLCFNKKRPGVIELTDRFNTAFKELQASGIVDEIHSKYR